MKKIMTQNLIILVEEFKKDNVALHYISLYVVLSTAKLTFARFRLLLGGPLADIVRPRNVLTYISMYI